MKHFLIIFVTISLFVLSCKTVRKTQVIQQAITTKDTAPTIVIKEIPKNVANESPHIDSAAIVRDIMSKVVKNKINFTTFNAKIKVTYEGPGKSDSYIVYIGMKKDSVILIQVVGSLLGIKGLGVEAKITKDSVIVVQVAGERSVKNRSINYLQEVIGIPFDFSTIQDLLIGNPVFIDSNIVSYKASANQLLVFMVGDLFKHLLTLDNADYTVLHSKLDDVDIQRNRTGDITFGSYQPMGPYKFATYRKISVAEKSQLTLYLDFKEFSLNEPLKYNFDIPKKYKRN